VRILPFGHRVDGRRSTRLGTQLRFLNHRVINSRVELPSASAASLGVSGRRTGDAADDRDSATARGRAAWRCWCRWNASNWVFSICWLPFSR
jgi:hypothetical protein